MVKTILSIFQIKISAFVQNNEFRQTPPMTSLSFVILHSVAWWVDKRYASACDVSYDLRHNYGDVSYDLRHNYGDVSYDLRHNYGDVLL